MIHKREIAINMHRRKSISARNRCIAKHPQNIGDSPTRASIIWATGRHSIVWLIKALETNKRGIMRRHQ